ncbi:MFS monocarboxylate transporter [Sclerotinia borealis F-4128]|uniref:MFS monocarboxylate transporter n=1 Tax=Sclerotinia borealis (strain F-4128) TaxID=1432307 RepID=W9CHN6_SCLBF|nr:MFS monocarboxylate transporter [Sclerotinia borealis F-4128]
MGFPIVAGPVFDHGYLKPLMWTGCLLCVLGMMLTSISSEYWHLLLAQGVMFSLCSGCLFIPSIAVLPAYFDKKQALALGIGAPGSAVGGIVFPIIFNQLQPRTGFGWSIRIFAFIVLLAATFPVLGLLGGGLTPYLVPLLNVGSFFGRIIPNHLADVYGPFNVGIICQWQLPGDDRYMFDITPPRSPLRSSPVHSHVP